MTSAATLTQCQFGTGTLIARVTNASNVAPALLGILQDVSLDIDSKLVDLMGQNRMPVDKAAGPMTIKGKAKSANMKILIPNLVFGQTITSGSQNDLATGSNGTGEAATVPATSAYTVTVANATSFLNDFGVYYQNGMGQLQPVASGPTQGQYSVSNGVYTFAAADASAAVFIYYTYQNNASGQSFLQYNPLMGSAVPQFELVLKNSSAFQGNTNNLFVRLYACKAEKLSLSLSNDKWLIPDFEFSAMQDSSGRTIGWGSTN